MRAQCKPVTGELKFLNRLSDQKFDALVAIVKAYRFNSLVSVVEDA